MPITDAEWQQIESADGLLTNVHTILKAGEPRAYAVNDFFRDVGPEAPEEFELLNALIDAVGWRVSRHRSELLVELALETLVFHGYAEKKMIHRDDDYIAYYRALAGQPDHAQEETPETVQATPEVSTPQEASPELDQPADQRPAQSPQ